MSFDENVEEFDRIEKMLVCDGWSGVYNPASVKCEDWSHEDYMEFFLGSVMPMCKCVYMRKGWEESKGAKMEHDWAIEHGKEVVYE